MSEKSRAEYQVIKNTEALTGKSLLDALRKRQLEWDLANQDFPPAAERLARRAKAAAEKDN